MNTSTPLDNSFKPSAAPSTWLGVMGGGQLGRMFTHAAQAMGYKVAVLEPASDCPAGHAADHLIAAAYTDADAQSLSALAANTFVAPTAACVSIAQDRLAEKKFFTACAELSGVLPAPHQRIASASDIDALPESLFPGILKTVRLGYDGKGQVRVKTKDEVRTAFDHMNHVECVLEKMLPLAYEVSVLAARGADGLAVVYPIAENVHRDGILFTTTVPGPNVSADCAKRAQAAALEIIHRLGYVGVLCVEFFVLSDGSLVVNEMAPRPHNSGHYTMDACITSQFAQQVRAMARLPLGDARQHSSAVMLNLLGDLWFTNDVQLATEPAWDKLLALKGANLHLYGKDDPRPGRKMGHVTFVAEQLVDAQKQCEAACQLLGIEH